MREDGLREKIRELKREKGALILVHNYQSPQIQEIADYLGDSLDLSRRARDSEARMICFCGVRFMAESAKILSPEKTVLLPRKESLCEMAAMVTLPELRALKAGHPRAVVVSYVNTTAEVKAESDVCCTSANAVKVVENLKGDQVIFVPDRNLAFWVSRFTPKRIIPWNGYCYVHERFTPEDVKEAKRLHSQAVVIVHPECRPGVVDLADRVESTGGMVRLARELAAEELIIGTEEGLIQRLRRESPEKRFYSAGPARMCRSMKYIRLEDVYLSLKEERFKVELPETIIERARTTLDRMLEYG